MIKLKYLPMLGLGMVLTSCQSESTSRVSESKSSAAPIAVAAAPSLSDIMASDERKDAPKILAKSGAARFWGHDGRIYVTGSEEIAIKFFKHGHLPYSKTILGAGPQGETVVFEVNKDDAAYAENLIEVFGRTPMKVGAYKNLSVYAFSGRLYMTGSEEMASKFEAHGHLPYTKTLLGEGPNGETLVFEVNKDDANYANQLIDLYHNMPRKIEFKEGFIMFKKGTRLYVVHSEEMAEKFAKHGHLPYTKTILGAGPNGETVVFEVDKDDASVAGQLISSYEKYPWLVKQSDNFNLYRMGERIYVTGDDMAAKFEAHGHLPYTKTILGAGVNGETVVFEVDKSDEQHAKTLIQKFEKTPWLIDEKENYYAYKLGGRIYVVGSYAMAKKFEAHGHLPYTKTILGAGPQGETLVFEVDKDSPALTDRLMAIYKK